MIKKLKETVSNTNFNNRDMYAFGLTAFSIDNLMKGITLGQRYKAIKNKIVFDMEEIIKNECFDLPEEIYHQMKSMKSLGELSDKYNLVGLTTAVLLVWSLLYDSKKDIKYTDKGVILENRFDNYTEI